MEVENVNVKNWKSLIKPSKLDVQISDDLTNAKIIAEPLEKGYKVFIPYSKALDAAESAAICAA